MTTGHPQAINVEQPRIKPGMGTRIRRLGVIARQYPLGAIGAVVILAVVLMALAAALAQPWVGVVLSGAAIAEQLQSNLGALDVVLTPTDWDELSEIAEAPQAYWSTRSRLAWN